MKVFQSIFPYDASLIAEYETLQAEDIVQILRESESAFRSWRETSFSKRSALMEQMAKVLRSRKEQLASLITHEMGKILAESAAEVEKCAWLCEHFAAEGERYLQEEPVDAGAKKSYVAFEPLGAVFAIMPWNYPFWQVFRFAVPACMAGNVALLKHAPNVSGCALAIENIFREAGFPGHVFRAMIMDIDHVEDVIRHPHVQGVTLTGSGRAGSAVAALAGKYIKKSVLELGGSDALIVLQDADLKLAARMAVMSRFQNAGQSCIASKRFIVHEKVYDTFTEHVVSHIRALRQGNPLQSEITTGPMARPDLAEKLEAQQHDALQKGAHLVVGGKRNGCNYEPTLLLGVRTDMEVWTQETFGPLACILPVKDASEALAAANSSAYGLGASVFTGDPARAEDLAHRLEAGSVFINTMVKSDPRLPFGGIKQSGYGRELSGFGIREFTNIKTVYIAS